MKKKSNLIWLLLLAAGTVWILSRQNKPEPYQNESGMIFGTIYNVTYQYKESLHNEIEDELKRFDASLSTFNDTSTISKINQNLDVIPDSLFLNVFRRSMEISAATNGCFDITVAPLVNAWGFGFKQNAFPDSVTIDSLLRLTGYQKVSLSAENKVIKTDPRIMLDCSAIAKGYAVDVVAHFLERKGITNYMVDIGGEVNVKGKNPKNSLWHIGINKPVDDSLSVNQEIQTVLALSDVAIATSGNYRNFYYKGNKKYAHTIDPHTGYPVQHNILSATVIAKDCMTADAYATSFMVMGLDQAKAFVAKHPDLEGYFIYSDNDGKYGIYFTEGMKDYFVDKAN